MGKGEWFRIKRVIRKEKEKRVIKGSERLDERCYQIRQRDGSNISTYRAKYCWSVTFHLFHSQ